MNVCTKFFLENYGRDKDELYNYLRTLDESERVSEIIAIGQCERIPSWRKLRLVLLNPIFLELLPEHDRKDMILSLLDDFYELSKYERGYPNEETIIKAIETLSEPERETRLKDFLKMAIQDGDHEQVDRTSKRIEHKLSKPEIEQLLDVNIAKGYFEDSKKIVKKLNRSLSQNEILRLLSSRNNSGDRGAFVIEQLIEMAKLLNEPQRTEQLEIALKSCIEEGIDEEAQKIAKLLKRVLTDDELEGLVRKYVKCGRVSNAQVAVARCNRELSQDEIIEMIKVRLRTWGTEDAKRLAQMLPEPQQTEQLERILESCIKSLDIQGVQKISSVLDREITEENLKQMLEIAIQEDDKEKAAQIVECWSNKSQHQVLA